MRKDRKKGLSTLLGTIILMGIAIVAGVSIFGIVNNFALVGFSSLQYTVVDASLTKVSGEEADTCLLTVTLMNTGTDAFKKTVIELSRDEPDADGEFSVSIPDSLLVLDDTTVEPSDTIEFNSLVFTNTTGELIDLSPEEETKLEKIQDAFSDCTAWSRCTSYTLRVLGTSTDSQTALSAGIQCKEADKI